MRRIASTPLCRRFALILLVAALLSLSVQYPLSLAQSAAPAVTSDAPSPQSPFDPERLDGVGGQNLRLAGPLASHAPDNAPASIAPTYQITGVVTAADSSLPFTSVEIDAYALDGTYRDTAILDGQGRFGFTYLGTGSYKVEFLVYGTSNYETEWYGSKSNFGSANVVTVTAGTVTPNINAALGNGGGHISGTVTAADTLLPIPNASVVVVDNQGFPIASGLADGSGNYVTSGLRTGSYRLRFRAFSPYDRYLRTYYDRKTTLQTADLVSVTAPQTTPNVDGKLLLGAQLTGHVSRSDNGQPIQYALAAVYDCLGKAWATGSTDASGNYSTTVGLPSGMYRVRFMPPGATTFVGQAFNAQPDLRSADRISVTAPAVLTNVDAVLTVVNGTITGTVTAASGGLPLSGITVRAFDAAGNVVQSASSDGAGQYALAGLPAGDYRIGFRSPNFVRQYFNNQPDLLSGAPVHVEASGLVQNVNAAMTTGAGIGGIAAVEGITPTGSVSVRVYDAVGRLVSGSVTDNSDGTYLTDPVPAGTYRVLFVPQADYGYQYFNDKLALNAADGVPVNPPTTTYGVNAALHQGGRIVVNHSEQATGFPNTLVVNAFNSSGHQVGGFSANFAGPSLISGLPTGAYRLQYDTSAFAPACAGPYLSGYYNFRPDLASADTVQVNAPDLTGVNMTLLFRSVLLPMLRR